jgi:hypothetical protein
VRGVSRPAGPRWHPDQRSILFSFPALFLSTQHLKVRTGTCTHQHLRTSPPSLHLYGQKPLTPPFPSNGPLHVAAPASGTRTSWGYCGGLPNVSSGAVAGWARRRTCVEAAGGRVQEARRLASPDGDGPLATPPSALRRNPRPPLTPLKAVSGPTLWQPFHSPHVPSAPHARAPHTRTTHTSHACASGAACLPILRPSTHFPPELVLWPLPLPGSNADPSGYRVVLGCSARTSSKLYVVSAPTCWVLKKVLGRSPLLRPGLYSVAPPQMVGLLSINAP